MKVFYPYEYLRKYPYAPKEVPDSIFDIGELYDILGLDERELKDVSLSPREILGVTVKYEKGKGLHYLRNKTPDNINIIMEEFLEALDYLLLD